MATASRVLTRRAVVGCLAALAAVALRQALPYRADLILRDGAVLDGSDAPARKRTLYVKDGVLVSPGWLRRVVGRTDLDVSGLVVAPGFIDVHTHVERSIPNDPEAPFRAWNFVHQGVTTLVTGNCGTSVRDVAQLRRHLDEAGAQVNVATFVGHNTLRAQVLGRDANRRATEQEIATMRLRLGQELDAGALGLSTGLGYAPGRFAARGEVLEIARALQARDGIYVTHIRDEGAGGEAALREALEIDDSLRVRTHISHFKAAGRAQWGTMQSRLRMLDGHPWPATLDVYPYDASSTGLDPLLPDWLYALPPRQRWRTIRQPAVHQQLKRAMEQILHRQGWSDYHFATVASYWPDSTLDGLGVHEIAARRARVAAPTLADEQEALIDMSLHGGAQIIYHEMSWADVELALRDPRASIGSDADVRSPEMRAVPHPRGMGTFPRVLSEFVRVRHALTLAQAVHKMTELPARTFGLQRRGLLRDGYAADITVFDSTRIRDQATYQSPLRTPDGIRYVFVAGVPTLWAGTTTHNNPGHFLARPGTRIPAGSDDSYHQRRGSI